jgi:phosphoribosylglycinamide formyltransferase 1
MNIGFLASHGGSNMQAIIDACKTGRLQAKPVVVISNNLDSGALARAKLESIPHYHLSSGTHLSPESLDQAILATLVRHHADVVVLAGYMKKIGPLTLQHFKGAILNVHPALLPKFGGRGMYGSRVHEAVIASAEKESGVSVHLVNEEYDAGPVIAQTRVPVLPDDTPENLAARVLEKEHELFSQVLQKIVRGEIVIPGFRPARI